MKSAAAVSAAFLALGLAAQPREAADLASQIRSAGLDPKQCYRVRDLPFVREDLRFFFHEGYLVLGNPVRGRRLFAAYSAGETGDAEILLRPPNAGERSSLATFTRSPNLSEHFRSAVFIFTDRTADDLLKGLRELNTPLPDAEMGRLLAEQNNSVVRNLSTAFSVRLAQDLLQAAAPGGFFFAAIAGRERGNFDVVHDPSMREAIVVGQLSDRSGGTGFDVWASFESRSVRNGAPPPAELAVLGDFRIQAALDAELRLSAVTRATLTPRRPLHSLAFEISPDVEIESATLDGAVIEVFRRESTRNSLIRGSFNETVLAVFPAVLEPGKSYQIEFKHAGKVVRSAGNRVYYVSSRTSWYPNHGLQFAHYDITFRSPKGLDLVATGDLVEESVEGETQVSRRRTAAPVRLAGFNLGAWQRAVVERKPYRVEVMANRTPEAALMPRPGSVIFLPPAIPRPGMRRPNDIITLPPAAPPDPTARLAELATDIAGAFEWMAQHFGPPPLNSLTVSPIPGNFGQGFPGLIYLSTLSYLREEERPEAARGASTRAFFNEILAAHETAHQWWGNLVTSATYHDDWILEALANYSALLVLEKRKGARALDDVLADYSRNLRRAMEDGKPAESSGPITWGIRLHSRPQAWRTIVYEKGSWIFHLLRRRMDDDAAFLRFLGELRRRYESQPISTEQLRLLAAEFLPKSDPDSKLEVFFDTWIYSTGLPVYTLSTSTKGKAPNFQTVVTLKQSEAPADFAMDLPLEIRVPGRKPQIRWLRTSSEPVVITLPGRPAVKLPALP